MSTGIWFDGIMRNIDIGDMDIRDEGLAEFCEKLGIDMSMYMEVSEKEQTDEEYNKECLKEVHDN